MLEVVFLVSLLVTAPIAMSETSVVRTNGDVSCGCGASSVAFARLFGHSANAFSVSGDH